MKRFKREYLILIMRSVRLKIDYFRKLLIAFNVFFQANGIKIGPQHTNGNNFTNNGNNRPSGNGCC